MAPRRKLTGAQAELFAAVCHHYINEAESDCNDTPESVPIFSHLSRAQRLKLVADVAIGTLCEDEPLPPDTIQHNSTFRAMIEILFTALSVESDTQHDHEDVGEDLLNYDETDEIGRKRTEEEMEDLKVKNALIEHRAEKNLKKLKKGKDVGEFHVEEKETPHGVEDMLSAANQLNRIYKGGAVSKRERDSIRPLNDDEKYAFRWRRLCDAALQQDTPNNSTFRDAFPLCNVNFDWRCAKCAKWYMALNLLLDTKLMDYGSATDKALITGEVSYKSYADPSQLPRVKSLERNINLLMKVYASSWDPKLLAIDQRRIYAICSNELYAGHYHRKWVVGFHGECVARGINFEEPGKNYQARLYIFRDTKDDLIDGCEYSFGCDEGADLEWRQRDWRPKEEGPKELGFEQRTCSGPGKGEVVNFQGSVLSFPSNFCWVTENLQSCSRCKAVLYCGRECQVADWKRGHKNVCARLAKERKDKEKISQMAKED
mmetsp:Transcript_14573/g.24502  ORF Transcript_14573/g.24502 Transcript_14573/m.24502 type:complete len:487 (-) Transcript_14573:190-1650(-)